MAEDTAICANCAVRNESKKHCFVLYNWEFSDGAHILGYTSEQDPNLDGYKIDYTKIKATFQNFGFDVKSEENAKTPSQMTSAVTKWLDGIDNLRDAECVVVFFLTHGANDGNLYACDGRTVHLDTLRSICRDRIPRGVPQLFFVQACRGTGVTEFVETNEARWRPGDMDGVFEGTKAGPKVTGAKFRDSLVYYPTMEGKASYVDKDKGSPFVDQVCATLKRFGKALGLWELITLINRDISSIVKIYDKDEGKHVGQCPEAVISLSKDVLFHSPLENSHHIEELKLKLKGRNHCYIFKNSSCSTHEVFCEQFDDDKNRVSETFRRLNFNVFDGYKRDDKYKSDLKGMLKDARHLKEDKDAECVVFVILSCGGEGGGEEQVPFPVVYDLDGALKHSIETIVGDMNEGELVDKTKLVFMLLKKCTGISSPAKACNRSKIPAVEKKEKKAFGTDTLIYYLVLEEENSTKFVTELCKALEDFSKKGSHLGDIVYHVNEKMSNIYLVSKEQVPEACSTLTKLVYFNYVGNATQCEDTEVDGVEEKTLGSEHVLTTVRPDIDNNKPPSDSEDGEFYTPPKSISLNEDIPEVSDMFREQSLNCDTTYKDSLALPTGLNNVNNNHNENSVVITNKQPERQPHQQASESVVRPTELRDCHTNDKTTSVHSATTTTSPTTLNCNQNATPMTTNGNNNKATPTTGNGNNNNGTDTSSSKKVLLLSDLEFEQEDWICNILNTGNSKWDDLGHLWVETYGNGKRHHVTKDDVDHLSKISGANEFLKQIKARCPDYTVRQLSDQANDLQRNDMVKLMQGPSWSDYTEKGVAEIPPNLKKPLIQHLDNPVKDWRHFVRPFKAHGFTNVLIKSIYDEAIAKRNKPADELLRLMNEEDPDFALCDFYKLLKNVRRNDIAMQVKDYYLKLGGKESELD